MTTVLDVIEVQRPWDERMDGLQALVDLLRHPETIFGIPSDLPEGADTESLDWDGLPEEISQCLEENGARCCDLYFQFVVGAEVLRKHGVKACRGGPRIVFIPEGSRTELFIQVGVEGPSSLVCAMNLELGGRLIDLGIPEDGVCLCFASRQRGEPDGAGLSEAIQ